MTPIQRASQAHLELVKACYHPKRMELISDFVEKLLKLPPVPLMRFCVVNAEKLRNGEKTVTLLGDIFERTKEAVDALNYILRFGRSDNTEQLIAQLFEAIHDFSLSDAFELSIIAEHRAHHNSELQ